MKTILLEENGEERKAYNSIVIDPKSLGVLNNTLSVKIVQELAKKPGCALDMARSLCVHEQKIYYHLRKLEAAGLISLLRHEKRFGMTANIYEAVSPVVAAKLYDDGNTVKTPSTFLPSISRLLRPFIENGKFDALVVLGDTYSHGKFDMYSREGVHAFDLAFLLGSFSNNIQFPNYKFDTEITEKELKGNIILIGHPQTNTIINKINEKLPLYFEEKDDWSIISRKTGKKIRDPRNGIIVKMSNPWNPSKKILVFGGRTRGTKSAVLAFTKFIDRVEKKIKDPDNFHFIVQGFDENGDKLIDEIKFVE